jgi:hypothetical protein
LPLEEKAIHISTFDRISQASLSSTIECLSTELWYEIFAYFEAIELYGTFAHLNSRITTALYFRLTSIGDYDLTSQILLPNVNNLANVKSIQFDQESRIEHFFSGWPPLAFSQLRCLSLVYLKTMADDCCIVLLESLAQLIGVKYLRVRVGCIADSESSLQRLRV